jgi:hypothetical protein
MVRPAVVCGMYKEQAPVFTADFASSSETMSVISTSWVLEAVWTSIVVHFMSTHPDVA